MYCIEEQIDRIIYLNTIIIQLYNLLIEIRESVEDAK